MHQRVGSGICVYNHLRSRHDLSNRQRILHRILLTTHFRIFTSRFVWVSGSDVPVLYYASHRLQNSFMMTSSRSIKLCLIVAHSSKCDDSRRVTIYPARFSISRGCYRERRENTEILTARCNGVSTHTHTHIHTHDTGKYIHSLRTHWGGACPI